MDDEISLLLVVILAIGGVMMMTALLSCYACIFRDLCCRRGESVKRRRSPRSPVQGSDRNRRPQTEGIPLNDITQGESMPTESEKV
ncbi:uncharacterized protein LOC111674151 [Orussus abietinus]|uniref:uncharacterized protein LOC111674151 n=1 Tax=Orussus abietinus TaxID=222816 RepID=UPI000C71632F|nr:uncharacterized protein LOC111674151 [Orussus abietinus]